MNKNILTLGFTALFSILYSDYTNSESLSNTTVSSILEEEKLIDNDNVGVAATNANFGAIIAVNGNTLTVASPYKGDVSVFNYIGNTWEFQTAFNVTKPPQDLGQVIDSTITSIAIDGNRIAVGSAHSLKSGVRSGSVDVFELQNTDWIRTATLRATNPESQSHFGKSVALSGNNLLIGAPLSDNFDLNAGAVFFFKFENGTWTENQIFKANDTQSSDQFGLSVSIYDNTLVVGAPFNNYNASVTGSAYVFDFDGINFTETQKLTGNSSAADSQFGSSVSINSSNIIIGAKYGFNDLAIRTGSAYIFGFDSVNWVLEDKVFAAQENSQFGDSVSIFPNFAVIGAIGSFNASSGAFIFEKNNLNWNFKQWLQEENVSAVASNSTDSIILGLPFYDNQYLNEGALEIYTLNGGTWANNQQIRSLQNGVEGDRFGASLSVLTDKMLIGVPDDNPLGSQTGTVKEFIKTNGDWAQNQIISPNNLNDGDNFGYELILNNQEAFISATGDDTNGQDSGAVYYFIKNGNDWIETQKIITSDGTADDNFGSEMSSFGNNLSISSNLNNNENSYVYIFTYSGGVWSEQQKLLSGQNDDNFGFKTMMTSDSIFISAPKDNRIYIYQLDNETWNLQETIEIPVGDFGSEFGASMTIENNNLIVTSQKPVFNIGGFRSLYYYIHIFSLDNGQWINLNSLEQLVSPNSSGPDFVDLSIENNKVVMSTHSFENTSFLYQSQIYFYELNNQQISLIKKYSDWSIDSDNTKMPALISDNYTYIGNTSDSINGKNSGSVRVFDLDPPDNIFSNGFENL